MYITKIWDTFSNLLHTQEECYSECEAEDYGHYLMTVVPEAHAFTVEAV